MKSEVNENKKITKPKVKIGKPKIKKKAENKKINILNKIDRKILIIAFIALILLITLITTIILVSKNSKYKHYEEKMKTYALDTLYDNETCKTSDGVTKGEAVKMAIATIFNTTDITWFAEEYNDYPNQTWIEYAKHFGIVGEYEITKNNYNEPAKYYEVVLYFERAKKTFSNKEIKGLDYVVLKNDATYQPEVVTAFADMVANEIIVVKTKNINGEKKAIKGQVNELVVNFLEKYSFVTITDSRLRFTDMPKNSEEYPYILFDIPQEVYEYEKSEGLPLETPLTSKELYVYKKDNYTQIKEYIENYYEAMLNVDYNNINVITYTKLMDRYLIYSSLTTSALEYCEYVKNNHIKMNADVTLMEPCIYFDGASYRARIKIDLNIESADTRDNLVLYDNYYNDTYTYNKDSYTIYADACLTNAIDTKTIYVESPIVLGNITLNSNDLDITHVTSSDTSVSEVVE